MKRYIKRFYDFGGGINDFTSPYVMKDRQFEELKNADVSTPGKLQKSLGYAELGTSTGTDAVRGLFVFEQGDGTKTLLRMYDTDLDKYASGWSNVVSTFTTSTGRARAVNGYVDGEERIYIVTEFDDDLFYYNGTTTGTVADIKAKHIEYYNNKIFLANIEDDGTERLSRVVFSGEGTDVFADTDYFDDVGEPITALKVYGRVLYIFTENRMFYYDGYTLTGVPGQYGTTSSESVQVVNGMLFFYNRTGVYVYGGTGLPTLVSRPIQGIIDSIADAGLVTAGVDDKQRYLLSVGDIGTDSDVVLKYDSLINAWSMDTDKPYGVFTLLKDDGGYVAYAGSNTTEKVYTLDTGDSEDLEAVFRVIGLENPQSTKRFYNIRVTYKPSGDTDKYITVQYRTTGDWQTVGGTANNVDNSGTDRILTDLLELPSQVNSKTLQVKVTYDGSAVEIYEVAVEYDIILAPGR